MNFSLKNKEYSLLIDEADQTTDLYEWYNTSDDIMMSEKIWSFNALIPNLTPKNISEKISLYLVFS